MTGRLIVADTWPAPIPQITVAGLPVAPLSTRQWVELMLSDHRAAAAGSVRARYHTAINGNVISVCGSDARIRALFEQADAVAADGVPVMVAAKYLAGVEIPDRAATTDLFHDLAKAAQDHGLSMYFLGTTEEENAAAVANVAALYPGLVIAGRQHGYFSAAEEPAIVAAIKAAKPDILWVALGMPREDEFAIRNLDALTGVTWVKTCGGLFNFLSGSRSRAPMWMQKYGLEWLYRTMLEPRRLIWRYATTNVHAVWLMLTRTKRAK